jgi:hypothetical protein
MKRLIPAVEFGIGTSVLTWEGPGIIIGIAAPSDDGDARSWFFAGRRWKRGPYIVRLLRPLNPRMRVADFEYDQLCIDLSPEAEVAR